MGEMNRPGAGWPAGGGSAEGSPAAAMLPQSGGHSVQGIASIEQGYFVFTLMPSLFCKLRCPHCYLSLAQRKDRTIMAIADLRQACEKVDAYFTARGLSRKTIICYWYGGEPTQMGQEYFTGACRAIADVFTEAKGYQVKHTVLSALVGVSDDWFPLFHHWGRGEVQSSYDGLMRGAGYLRQWEKTVRAVVADGLRLSTISVVNRELLEQGPVATLDYLADLGVAETSWLPFMWNDQNATGAYDQFAPTMAAWSEFMIALTEAWAQRRADGRPVPEIGQLRFILEQRQMPQLSNIAGQTLFLLPNGDFVLPDYREGWREFMQPFGNILTDSFEQVLKSPARRRYLRRQTLRNNNPECLDCSHSGHCVMEFWKDNRPGDDCFGGRRYVEWVLTHEDRLRRLAPGTATLY